MWTCRNKFIGKGTNMRIDICIVLISGFIEEQEGMLLLGSSVEIYSEIYGVAQEVENDEIIACMDRIADLDMVENCFPENTQGLQVSWPSALQNPKS